MLPRLDRNVPGTTEPRLRTLLTEGARLARRRGRDVLVSAVIDVSAHDPLSFFQRGFEVASDRVFWSRPGGDCTLVGVASTWTFSARGSHRFDRAAGAWRDLCDGALIDSPTDAAGVGPTVLAGFAFDPLHARDPLWAAYPDALLIVPRYTLTATDQGSWLTVNVVVSPQAAALVDAEDVLREARQLFTDVVLAPSSPIDPDFGEEEFVRADEWKEIVGSVVGRIRGGELEKVVLARARRVQGRGAFRPARILHRLRADYPGCFHFAFDRGSSCFLGASPELLVSLEKGRLRTVCLAGSTARGATSTEDRRLGDELLASTKNRAEHAIVVRGITDSLTALGVQLDPVGEPSLVKVANIQHLFTPITGQVGNDQTVLDLLGCLHPTPSVGGSPRAAALQVIHTSEGLDRGWYAGAVGWLDAQGQGEFAVAIRSALLRGAEAVAFAGCGIVADSDPELEYAESCLKLRPILSALRQGVD